MSKISFRTIRYFFALLALSAMIFPVFPAGRAAAASLSTSIAAPTAETPSAVSTVSFEENRGQFDKRVRYAARTGGTTLFLTADEAVYVLPFDTDQESKVEDPKSEIRDPKSPLAFALRMKLVGANPESGFAGENIREQRTNYFRGAAENWHANVPNFGAVRYENVYDGVGMLWQGQENGATRYDFVIAPNADAGRIELSFDGADSLELDAGGDLLIHTPAGTLRQNKPYTYQETDGLRQEIESGFRLEDGRVKFSVGEYDRSKPLTIDPTVTLNNLASSTFIGGLGDDQVNAVAADGSGTIIAGQTASVNFPTTAGAFDTSINGGTDAFVAKLNASGTGLIFSTFIGGGFGDFANAMSVDPNGAVYLTGNTNSGDFPVTAGAFDTTYNGGVFGDAFALKLNSSGATLNFSTFLGGSGEDNGNGIAVDAGGNVLVIGSTEDAATDFPTTAGAFDTTHNGAYDVYVAKLTPGGSALVYSTFLGGTTFDFGYGVAVDSSGSAYVTGDAQSANFPTTAGSIDTTQNGSDDAFVTKLNTFGTALVYSTFVGGPGTDFARVIGVDQSGNAYVTGSAAAGFPTTAGAFDTTQSGGFDAFVLKVHFSGSSLSFSTFLGGTGNDAGRGLALDQSGNVYVTGDTADAATDFPTTTGAYDTVHNGGNDAFLAQLNNGGATLNYSTFLGGVGTDSGNSVALDPTGNVYLGGSTTGGAPSFPVTPGAYQGFASGGIDGFVSKFGNYAIAGKVIDATTGNPIPNVMIALSGQVSGNQLTGADGRFVFQETIAGEPHTVSATRAGYSINPAIFNIANLNNNRELIFVGAVGSPTGGSGGTFSFQNLSYNRAENGGTVTLTVKRSGTITESNPVTVDYQTFGGTAVAGQDFVQSSGVLSFATFETSKTITIPLVNDDALEPRESFTVVLSNPTNNADIEPNRETAAVKILDEDLASGDLLISEFRERGRLGANDEYVKLFNPHDFDVTVQTADGSGGLTLASATGAALTPLVTIPNAVTIAAHGHYLLTNNSPNGGFSLIDYPTGSGTTTATGDQVFSTNIPDNADLVLLKTVDPNNFTPANKLDAVGFAASGWSEGKPLPSLPSENTEMSFVRRINADGLRDTNNNAADFLLVDNHARTFTGGDQSRIYAALGAPAPETSESLRLMSAAQVSVEEFGSESYSSAPVPNGAQGVLTVYRKITNNTDQPLTALRLRAVDFPTLGSELQKRYSSRPDFRLLSSADEGAGIKGVTLAAEILQPNGGGLNSTLTIGAIDSANPLPPGQSVVVAIRFGVMRYGRHPLSLSVEGMQ